MREFQNKTYWLIGASEGLGNALAKEMSKNGAKLILSARNKERLEQIAHSLPNDASILPLDISNSKNVADAAKMLPDHLDGIVFLAGVYWPMRAENWNAQQAETMIDVNLNGALRCLSHVIPNFVKRKSGHIVITGSLSAFRGLPGTIGYGASKAGLMSLAETLAYDLKSHNIDVQLVNPGFIKTRLTEKNDFEMPFIMNKEKAAKAMFKHMLSRRFQISFPKLFSFVFRLSRFIPDALYFRLFR